MKQTLDVTARKETLEEVARRELNSSYAMAVNGEFVYQHAAMLNMFRKGVHWAENHQWTSVNNELPVDNQSVLAYFLYYYRYADREAESRFDIDIFTYKSGKWITRDYEIFAGKEVSKNDIKITHWISIPKLEE